MSETKWTPAPWEADGKEELDKYFPHVFIGPALPYGDGSGSNRQAITVNCGPSVEMVQRGSACGTTMETAWANACLIAAAPKMYEALAAVEEWWLTDQMHKLAGAPACIFMVRQALKEARGEGELR